MDNMREDLSILEQGSLQDKVRVLSVTKDHPRQGTFGESDSDSDKAMQFKLKGSDGRPLDEVVSIIENPMGTVLVVSSLGVPQTTLIRVGVGRNQPVVFNEYRVAQQLAGRYCIVADIPMRVTEALRRVSPGYDVLPICIIQDTLTGEYYQMFPVDQSSPRFGLYLRVLSKIQGSKVSGLNIEERNIDGRKVLLNKIEQTFLLFNSEEVKTAKAELTPLGLNQLEIEWAISILEHKYKAARVFSRAHYRDRLFEILQLEEHV